MKEKNRVAVSIWLISPHDGRAEREPSVLRENGASHHSPGKDQNSKYGFH